ncbi:MAG: hypothetical protein HY513_04920 [Candidatus Aenigmarchaeota archaeon]|nr:hypothetical protein [Candidatus Aenigmarchaeota archaeon]
MEKLLNHMLTNFNMVNNKNCNFIGCGNLPDKRVLVYEFQLSLVKKEIAMLNLCKQHYTELPKIVKDLKLLEPEKIIMTKTLEVLEMGR